MRFCLPLLLLPLLLLAGCTGSRATEMTSRTPPSSPPPHQVQLDVPEPLRGFVESLSAGTLGGVAPAVAVEPVAPGLWRLRLTFRLPAEVQQDDWQLVLQPAFDADFHWAPHLTPTDAHVIDQHVFRSPALIAAAAERQITLIPDLDLLGRGDSPVRWYLDLDARSDRLVLGLSESEVQEHVLFVRRPGARYPAGEVHIGCFLLASADAAARRNPWRPVLAFLWERWGQAPFEAGQPLPPDLSPYVEHTYRWAFEGWRDAVWQQLELGGRPVGAPVFIVNQTQSPNYPGEVDEREFRSIWNQAWFSSLRSASGLFRHARRKGDEGLLAKAKMTKELALAAPQQGGFFPAVLATEMAEVDVGGKKLRRSGGWGTAFWGSSDRNPLNRPAGGPRNDDIRIAPFHVLDMSWTALMMLRWYDELEKDERLLAYARRYADSLLGLQRPSGSFPAWLDRDSLEPLAILADSPEAALSATFLFELAALSGEPRYRTAALAAVDFVAREIVPQSRWEDFETYWSCSAYGNDQLIGRKVERNNLHKQNSFSMFWTAEALLSAYRATGARSHLELGRRVLDELLMTQASWQPPYMHVSVLGGFGVMNADAEWNDARSSLFAELIIRYGRELSLPEYEQRGLAALRSSFVMMYCPENPRTRAQWEQRFPFFGPADYGFMMENYGHDGRTDPAGLGMGVFTIYDWGNGAAAEAYSRLLDHLGEPFVLRSR